MDESGMTRKMLVVSGVENVDDLQALGLPMAHKFAEADLVALVHEGRGAIVKGAKEATSVHFVDVDSRSQRCIATLRRLYDKGADTNDVGMFLFFWPVDPEKSQRLVIDAMDELDADAVEDAAQRFIDSDFGEMLDGATLSADGDRDAAGRSASAS